jgi:Entner-Doudoroff aldolase
MIVAAPHEAATTASATQRLNEALAQLPVIAILRGIRSDEAVGIVQALYEAGVRVAEVPLNSPEPFVTIRALVAHFGERMVLGAGTVTTVEQVQQLAACGAQLCVSPNTDTAVIKAALAAGMVPVPGFLTPTEAFAAVGAGARHLKMFPAAGRGADLAALRSVLPRDVKLVAVGGINVLNCDELAAAGAQAFGIGGDLYRPGMHAAAVGARALAQMPYFGRALLAKAATLVCNPQAMIGESPLWQQDVGRLLWTDPLTRRLLHCGPDGTGAGETWLEASVFGIAALPNGDVAGTLARSLCHIDTGSGAIVTGPAAALAPGMRFNDLAVDAHGGLWAGAMHGGLLGGTGALYYAANVAQVPRLVASGLGVPNGMAFSHDGSTLYLIDTLSRTLLAYPVDALAASLGEPAIVTDFMGIPGKPDGMTIDPDGCLWVAMWGGACVVRIAPDGALLQTVRVPAPHVSSACFDPAGTLYVTTSRMRLGPRQLADAPGSGAMFAIEGAASML